MTNPIQKIIEFHNLLMEYKTYDLSHLVDPKADYITREDIDAFFNDFQAIDQIYIDHYDFIDFSLRIRVEQLREPIVDALSQTSSKVKIANVTNIPPGDLNQLFEDIHVMDMVSYPNDLRDVAREQISRYQKVLGEEFFTEQ